MKEATRPLKCFYQKCLCFLDGPPAASSAAISPPGLNASGNTATPAGPPSRFFIGLSLTLGFTLMFVVDQVGGYLTSHGMFGKHQFSQVDCHHRSCASNWGLITGGVSSLGVTATLGLVIHAAGTLSLSIFFFVHISVKLLLLTSANHMSPCVTHVAWHVMLSVGSEAKFNCCTTVRFDPWILFG